MLLVAKRDFGMLGFSAWEHYSWNMKTLALAASIISLALFLTACGDNSAKSGGTNATTSGSPLTAPVDYLAAAGKAQQSAVKMVDTTSVNKAIEMFSVDKGRYPKDLNELVQEKYISKIPEAPYGMKLSYDATAGKVTVVKQ
jgi:hypothetical protein